MNTIKGYINEALFSKGPTTIVDRIDASYKLSRLPKTEKEYLNYMCAWNLVFQQCYEAIEASCINMGELMAYMYRLYFCNLPNFHLKLKGSPYEYNILHRESKYDTSFDEYLAQRGKLSYDETFVNNKLDEMTSLPDRKIRQIRTIRDDITDIAYAGKMESSVTEEAWVIARRAVYLSRKNWTEAKSNFIKGSSKWFYDNSIEMLQWLDVIKSTMMKSIYKDSMKKVFDSLEADFNW